MEVSFHVLLEYGGIIDSLLARSFYILLLLLQMPKALLCMTITYSEAPIKGHPEPLYKGH